MRRRPSRSLLAALTVASALALALSGCSGPAGEPSSDSEPPPAEAPSEPGARESPSGSGGESGGGGECAAAPAANEPGAYPADSLPAVEARTDELVATFEAADGRYCIDSAGDITYFLIFDFAEDGFHSLDVCGSVFTYFEGDFEGAAVVYTDATVRCG